MSQLILAIESSSVCCGVSLGSTNNEVLFKKNYYEKHVHDKVLASLVRECLKETGVNLNKIDAVAISSGPGSFTGLRVGASIAKGITFGNTPPLIAVNNLDAFARRAIGLLKDKFSLYRVIIKSHKDIYYKIDYDVHGSSLTKVELISEKQLLESDNENIFSVGSFPDTINFFNSDKELNIYSSELILKIAIDKFNNNDFTISENFTPDYFQDFNPN